MPCNIVSYNLPTLHKSKLISLIMNDIVLKV